MTKEIMTIEDAGMLLEIPVSTLYKMAQEDRIPARKVGRRWRFSRTALIRWVGREPEPTPTED